MKERLSMDFNNLITVVAGSSLVSALVTIGIDTLLRARESRRRDNHLALRLAFLLEGYAIECTSRLSDHDLAAQTDGHMGKYIGSVPELMPLPTDDYRTFEKGLLSQLLEFPQRVKLAVDEAAFCFDVDGTIEAMESIRKSTAGLAQLALEVSCALRSTYKLPARKLVYGRFDVPHVLDQLSPEASAAKPGYQ